MPFSEPALFTTRRTHFFAYILLLVPISLFYSLFSHFLNNIPYIDDFYWYFRFIDNFDKASTFIDKLTIFLEPYNSHRHYVQRILVLLFVYLFGEINIAFFVVVGNLFLLFLVYNLSKYSIRTSVGFIFLVWLFFQPISYINYYTFAFFNLPVLLFVWLFLRLAVQQANLKWIILVGLLATFSNGNGILVWVLGMLIAFTQTNYKRLFTFGSILTGLSLLFVLQGSHSEMGQTNHSFTVESLFDSILYFVQLHASFINWSDYHLSWLGIVVGFLLLILFGSFLVRLIKKRQSFEQPVLFYYLLFLSLSMALISLGRASMEGLTAIIVDHYKIYACLFLGCIVCYYCTSRLLSKQFQITLLLIAVLITGVNYGLFVPRMYAHFNRQLAEGLTFNVTKKWLFYPPIQGKKEYEFVNAVSNSVVNKKLYAPFSPTVVREKNVFIGQRDSTQSAATLRVENVNFFPLMEEAFFVVNCQKNTYYFPAVFERSWKDLLKGRLKQPEVTTVVDWNIVQEPCDSPAYTTQFAVLNGNNLLSSQLTFGIENEKKQVYKQGNRVK